jgi:FKBP-type peptidyl-prolyl cis-trans isomerase
MPPPVSSLNVPRIAPPADVAQPPADAQRTSSSIDPARILLSKIVEPGRGAAHPGATDVVTVHYTAWSTDGTTLDDSRSRGAPAVWIPKQLMEGLSAGIQLMVAGERRRLWIPAAMAHEWASGTLVFDVELVTIAPAPDQPIPAEIGAPPADLARTASGLGFMLLRAGTGREHPKPTATVTIHSTAWTSNGLTIFDDTVARRAPMTVAVDTVMPGLSEALQRMVVGEKTRFWIPPALAVTPGPGPMSLVFDIELLAIQRAIDGRPGTVRVHSNSPDAPYVLVLPDGTPRDAHGPQTFADVAPGHYRIKPVTIPLYTIGTVALPRDMMLAAGGTLDITITYVPIVR